MLLRRARCEARNETARCESVTTGYYGRTVPRWVHVDSSGSNDSCRIAGATNFKNAGATPALPRHFPFSFPSFIFVFRRSEFFGAHRAIEKFDHVHYFLFAFDARDAGAELQ
jgi:hypothetical protein